ncbi:MAG: hypothetical protein ACOX4L_03705 [Bacillota bacterium]|jgi:hypothetical protein
MNKNKTNNFSYSLSKQRDGSCAYNEQNPGLNDMAAFCYTVPVKETETAGILGMALTG